MSKILRMKMTMVVNIVTLFQTTFNHRIEALICIKRICSSVEIIKSIRHGIRALDDLHEKSNSEI